MKAMQASRPERLRRDLPARRSTAFARMGPPEPINPADCASIYPGHKHPRHHGPYRRRPYRRPVGPFDRGIAWRLRLLSPLHHHLADRSALFERDMCLAKALYISAQSATLHSPSLKTNFAGRTRKFSLQVRFLKLIYGLPPRDVAGQLSVRVRSLARSAIQKRGCACAILSVNLIPDVRRHGIMPNPAL